MIIKTPTITDERLYEYAGQLVNVQRPPRDNGTSGMMDDTVAILRALIQEAIDTQAVDSVREEGNA